jgi:hypothetical protein
MRFGPGPSWQISTSDPFDVFFALYVRDAACIAAADDVPPLTPPVPGWSTTFTERQMAALTEQWMTWWSALLTDPGDTDPGDGARRGVDGPDFSSTVDAAELRDAQQMIFPDACEWMSANRWDERHSDAARALMPTHLVAELEREAGRQAPPFSYSVEVIPAGGAWCRDLSATRVLLSTDLFADTDAFRETLRPRLAALMTDALAD